MEDVITNCDSLCSYFFMVPLKPSEAPQRSVKIKI